MSRFLVFLLISLAVAQVCQWFDVRSGVVRDTFYLEGGLIGASATLRPAGLAQFNFSSTFNQSSNFTDLFRTTNITTDPLLRTHVSGYMFADDDEWYSFGGRAFVSVSPAKSDTGITRDGLYARNSAVERPQIGLTSNYAPSVGNSSNQYITNGAGVSVPSERLGFYFGGLRTINKTHINWNAQASSANYSNITVDTMLKVDTGPEQSGWYELPLPPFVAPRAEAVLSWIPTGTRGALILVGGVPFPASLDNICNINATLKALNNEVGPAYMKTVSIYDIANDAWYNQSTSGPTPPQLAQSCAIVASSADNTIHNIHVYGGYNGVDGAVVSDDIWILSVPSFTWIKVQSNDTTHGRFRHACAKPYPDQMLVIGGTTNCNTCLRTSAFADIFNLSSLTWTGSYNPKIWSEYNVPSRVSSAISATPTASMSVELLALFNNPYPGNISKWYPYKSTDNGTAVNPSPTSAPSPIPTTTPQADLSRQGWFLPVVIVVPIIAAVIVVGILVWWCVGTRKFQSTRKDGWSRRSIAHWALSKPEKPPTVNTDDDATQVESIYPFEAAGDSYFPKDIARANTTELAGDSQLSSHFGSPLSSSGLPSPRSRVGVELYAPPPRHELPAIKRNSLNHSQNIKSHYMYPPSFSGHTINGQDRSVSSPTSGPVTPYELPQNRSNEKIFPLIPNDMVLNNTYVQSSQLISTDSRASTNGATAAVSPNLSGIDISPRNSPVNGPITPPQRPVMTTKSMHARNTSSISSNLPDLSSPSPREDQRRSNHIATLPDSPNAQDHMSSSSLVLGDMASAIAGGGSVVPAPGLGIRSESEQRAGKVVRRKQLPNTTSDQN